MHKKTLPFNEQIILFLFLSIIGIVVISSAISTIRFKELHLNYKKTEPVLIKIEGAVHYPGIYSVLPGVSLKNLLKKASLKKEADLKNLDLEKRFHFSDTISVPELEFITVYLEGAIKEPLTFHVKNGSTISSLAKFVTFEKNADTAILRSRCKLKDQQKIYIPFLN